MTINSAPRTRLPLSVTLVSSEPQSKLKRKMEPKQTPADFLRLLMGRSVRVKLVSGEEYLGIMVALDETMNVVLEKAEEFVDGLLNKKYEEIFLRGNNGRQN